MLDDSTDGLSAAARAFVDELRALTPAQRSHFLAIVDAGAAFDADPSEELFEALKRVASAPFGSWPPGQS